MYTAHLAQAKENREVLSQFFLLLEVWVHIAPLGTYRPGLQDLNSKFFLSALLKSVPESVVVTLLKY